MSSYIKYLPTVGCSVSRAHKAWYWRIFWSLPRETTTGTWHPSGTSLSGRRKKERERGRELKKEGNLSPIGEFRILGRPRTSACFFVKARLMRVTSHQEDKQTWENCGWVAEEKEHLKRWKVLEVSKLTYRLEKSLFQMENQLVISEKNNEPNQKLTEIVVGEWVQ